MAQIKVTNVKVYKPTVEVSVTEKNGKLIDVAKKKNSLVLNFHASDFMDKEDLEKYREKFKKEPSSTVLLTYEEYE